MLSFAARAGNRPGKGSVGVSSRSDTHDPNRRNNSQSFEITIVQSVLPSVAQDVSSESGAGLEGSEFVEGAELESQLAQETPMMGGFGGTEEEVGDQVEDLRDPGAAEGASRSRWPDEAATQDGRAPDATEPSGTLPGAPADPTEVADEL